MRGSAPWGSNQAAVWRPVRHYRGDLALPGGGPEGIGHRGWRVAECRPIVPAGVQGRPGTHSPSAKLKTRPPPCGLSQAHMPAQATRLVLFASIQVRMRAHSGTLLCAETCSHPRVTDGACGATLIGHNCGPNDARGGHRRRRVPVGDAARPLLFPGARRRLRHVLCLE